VCSAHLIRFCISSNAKKKLGLDARLLALIAADDPVVYIHATYTCSHMPFLVAILLLPGLKKYRICGVAHPCNKIM
jgi:hypothetical protein